MESNKIFYHKKEDLEKMNEIDLIRLMIKETGYQQVLNIIRQNVKTYKEEKNKTVKE